MDGEYECLVQLRQQRVANKRAKAEHQEDFYSFMKDMLQSVDDRVEL